MQPVLVIGIGNEFRQDDGVGPAVARRMGAAGLPGMTAIEQSGEGAALMQAWREAVVVILVDAVSSGSAPGTIHRFDAQQQSIPTNFFSYSTHAFSVAEAVEMARVLGELPPTLIIYGIEGETFGAGTGLSPAVEQAARSVIERLTREIAALQSSSGK